MSRDELAVWYQILEELKEIKELIKDAKTYKMKYDSKQGENNVEK